MCGICGIISSDLTRNQLEVANNIQAHRGPDDYGLFYNGTGLSVSSLMVRYIIS
jgi:asparagine synthetase B (glutamine-hydrolysing)